MGSFPLLAQAKGFTESLGNFLMAVTILTFFAFIIFLIWGIIMLFKGNKHECMKKMKYCLFSFCTIFAICLIASATDVWNDENVNNNNNMSTKKEITISTPEEDAKEVSKLIKEGNPKAEEVLRKKTDLYLTKRGGDETRRFLDLATKFVTQ